jgi:3,4-dihydroxy 2-butanone 4-phosphate synthase / GTP cyclohydrolase II
MNTHFLSNDNRSDGSPISPIEEIIADIKAGKMVVLVDDEGRENEGDLVIAAEYANASQINFMARQGCGLICLTLTEERADQFELGPMTGNNTDPHGTAFTVSIDAKHGISTGISAGDRATTIDVLLQEDGRAGDLVSPGHLFPLIARDGGVLERAGHTEASVDLAVIAGLKPAAVICEIMNEDGTMARLPDLTLFAARHGLKIGAIEDLIAWRAKETLMSALMSEKARLSSRQQLVS